MDNWKNKTNGEKKLPNREQKLQAEYGALMVYIVKTEKLINEQPLVLVGKWFSALVQSGGGCRQLTCSSSTV